MADKIHLRPMSYPASLIKSGAGQLEYVVSLSQPALDAMARKAQRNSSRKSVNGPLTITILKTEKGEINYGDHLLRQS